VFWFAITQKNERKPVELALLLDAFTEGLTSRNLSVLQQVQSLSVDRPYSEFSLKDLRDATASFSPGKLKSHYVKP